MNPSREPAPIFSADATGMMLAFVLWAGVAALVLPAFVTNPRAARQVTLVASLCDLGIRCSGASGDEWCSFERPEARHAGGYAAVSRDESNRLVVTLHHSSMPETYRGAVVGSSTESGRCHLVVAWDGESPPWW